MYDIKEGFFNKNFLNQILEDFWVTFLEHKFLYTLISKMVEFDYKQRPSIKDLFKSLP